jgi:hypothetical protein
LGSELFAQAVRAEIGSGDLFRALAFPQEFVLDDAAVVAALALAVSVFAAGLVSAGTGLLPESPVLESPVFDSLLEELSDESLVELLFDA